MNSLSALEKHATDNQAIELALLYATMSSYWKCASLQGTS